MNIGIFRRIFSFIWPVVIEKYTSHYNQVLEISLYQNKLHLNSAKANYSFGSLHAVMKKGLKIAKKHYNSKFNRVLLLGYGGGSVAKILVHKYNSEVQITAVEIDSKVIEIAKAWFPQKNVVFVNADAEEFLGSICQKFDLIVCDVFIDLETPQFFSSFEFYRKIGDWLTEDGLFFQNLMMADNQVILHFNLIRKYFKNPMFVNVVDTNRLYFGKAL